MEDERTNQQSLILENDLKKVRQKEPGVITTGGYVINGNRRMSILQNLVEQGDSDFNYLEVARLPSGVSATDIWKIEAGIQLSRRVQLDYGPINNLLKFQQGIEAGLSPKEIAKLQTWGFIKFYLTKFRFLKNFASPGGSTFAPLFALPGLVYPLDLESECFVQCKYAIKGRRSGSHRFGPVGHYPECLVNQGHDIDRVFERVDVFCRHYITLKTF